MWGVPLSPPSEAGRVSAVQSEGGLLRTISQHFAWHFPNYVSERESGKALSQMAVNGGRTEQTGLGSPPTTTEPPPIASSGGPSLKVTMTTQEVQSPRASRTSPRPSGHWPSGHVAVEDMMTVLFQPMLGQDDDLGTP